MHPEIDEDADRTARLAAFDALMRPLDAARTEERHGMGRIFFVRGRPQHAEGCLLPDGTMTNATVVALPGDRRHGGFERSLDDPDGRSGDADASDAVQRIDPEACIWRRPLAPNGAVARRGRLVVEPGVALRFVDAPEAGEEQNEDTEGRAVLPPSLERDLAAAPGVALRLSSDLFAQLLYAALCNTEWRHRPAGTLWSCSWRSAGGVVAHLRGKGDYMDWYCLGGEELVDEGVLVEIERLGWDLVPAACAMTDDTEWLPDAGTPGDAP